MPKIAISSIVFLLLVTSPALAATTCENLVKVGVPNTTITHAQNVSAGAFTPPAGARGGNQFANVPAFCRVQATLKPSSDSDIKMELWLPTAANWNGKFRGTGNGGLGGGAAVNPNGLANGVRLGYATAGNNTGHEGDSSYAIDHPEKIKDFGYRAAHETTVVSKALIKAYYDTPLKYSVIAEGGGGTIAALSAAQRYPEDFDIIAVTGMSSYLSRHTFGQMWYWQATHETEHHILTPKELSILHAAALNACDANDSLKDGLIGNPETCRVDVASIVCYVKGATPPNCLSKEQADAALKIYQGPINPRTKQEVYSPMYPGSELGWGQLAGGAQPLGIPIEFFKYFVFKDPNWDYKKRPVNFDSDLALADKADVAPANAVDPDLRKFFARGGKLLLVDGWSDSSVPPKVAINYYKAIVEKTGAKEVKESMRFFMVPGMGHGPGTTGDENFNYDALSVIEQWKQTGKAPEELIFDHYKNGMMVGKRLVCQYPKVPTYKGSGNAEDPASFACK
jgi:Tannase and feruloyl esterase